MSCYQSMIGTGLISNKFNNRHAFYEGVSIVLVVIPR
jgi:hypothetical protein